MRNRKNYISSVWRLIQNMSVKIYLVRGNKMIGDDEKAEDALLKAVECTKTESHCEKILSLAI